MAKVIKITKEIICKACNKKFSYIYYNADEEIECPKCGYFNRVKQNLTQNKGELDVRKKD